VAWFTPALMFRIGNFDWTRSACTLKVSSEDIRSRLGVMLRWCAFRNACENCKNAICDNEGASHGSTLAWGNNLNRLLQQNMKDYAARRVRN
jgi:hypothetical protein